MRQSRSQPQQGSLQSALTTLSLLNVPAEGCTIDYPLICCYCCCCCNLSLLLLFTPRLLVQILQPTSTLLVTHTVSVQCPVLAVVAVCSSHWPPCLPACTTFTERGREGKGVDRTTFTSRERVRAVRSSSRNRCSRSPLYCCSYIRR